jgi:polysaccharide export outer membrane protein
VVIVPPDRILSFPLIGDVNVTNLTVTDLREVVTKKLSEYVPDATVTVMILEFNYLKAFVIGKVNRPGVFPITMETNVMHILSSAGGFAEWADEKRIMIIRREGEKEVQIRFNYKDYVSGKNLEQNILLKPNDTIVVP